MPENKRKMRVSRLTRVEGHGYLKLDLKNVFAILTIDWQTDEIPIASSSAETSTAMGRPS
jgi:hypothetical protein